MEDTPLMMASSSTDLNVKTNRNEETRNSENIEDGSFPALKTNYDRQTHTLHSLKQGKCCKNYANSEPVDNSRIRFKFYSTRHPNCIRKDFKTRDFSQLHDRQKLDDN